MNPGGEVVMFVPVARIDGRKFIRGVEELNDGIQRLAKEHLRSWALVEIQPNGRLRQSDNFTRNRNVKIGDKIKNF